jgi:hypothetical protein
VALPVRRVRRRGPEMNARTRGANPRRRCVGDGRSIPRGQRQSTALRLTTVGGSILFCATSWRTRPRVPPAALCRRRRRVATFLAVALLWSVMAGLGRSRATFLATALLLSVNHDRRRPRGLASSAEPSAARSFPRLCVASCAIARIVASQGLSSPSPTRQIVPPLRIVLGHSAIARKAGGLAAGRVGSAAGRVRLGGWPG